jgi:hypothetical protein
MSSDDLTHHLNSDEEGSTTQPTITAVFRLLREVRDGQTSLNSRVEVLESSVNSRFNEFESSVNSRFEALESRLARDFAGVDARFAEMTEEMKNGFLQLSDKLCDRIDLGRLRAEAVDEDMLRRLRKLESKAS